MLSGMIAEKFVVNLSFPLSFISSDNFASHHQILASYAQFTHLSPGLSPVIARYVQMSTLGYSPLGRVLEQTASGSFSLL